MKQLHVEDTSKQLSAIHAVVVFKIQAL